MTEPTDARPSDSHPASDRREHVLDPSAGAVDHGSATIRDEQSTHEAGAVPAAFTGADSPAEDAGASSGTGADDGDGGSRPEDSQEPDGWDSAAHRS